MKAQAVLQQDAFFSNATKNALFIVEKTESLQFSLYNADRTKTQKMQFIADRFRQFINPETGKVLFKETQKTTLDVWNSFIIQYEKAKGTASLLGVKNGKPTKIITAEDIQTNGTLMFIKDPISKLYDIYLFKNGIFYTVGEENEENETRPLVAEYIDIYENFVIFGYDGKEKILFNDGTTSQWYVEAVAFYKKNELFYIVADEKMNYFLLNKDLLEIMQIF